MSKKPYLPAADVLRVLAIFLVACFHIWQQSWLFPGIYLFGRHIDLTPIVRRGYMMVDIMLLLSGFLLYLPFARSEKPRPDALPFYKKRLIRIVPSYSFAVFAALIFALVYGREAGSPPLWADLLLHLTFTQTLTRSSYLWTSLNVALWTVAVEMQFYLFFPLLAAAFKKRPWLTFFCMTALALLCRGLLLPRADVSVFFNQLPCMLDLYACGMLAAHLRAKKEELRPRWLAVVLSLLCLVGILFILRIQNPADNRELNQLQMLWRLPLGLLGGGFLYFGSFWPEGEEKSPWRRILVFLSGISYNFYIWHQYLAVKLKLWRLPPYFTDLPQMNEGPVWQRKYTWLCFAVAFAAAVLCTYLIEKPAARLLSRRREKNTGGTLF